jgi:hypothetical protein
MENARAVWRDQALIEQSAAIHGDRSCDNIIINIRRMSVNGASTTFGLASWKMQRLCSYIKR